MTSGDFWPLRAGDGGVGHVERVRRTERLGQHVVNTGDLEDGAGSTTGDDAGTGSGGLEQHATGTGLADDRVDDRGTGERNA